MSGILAAAMKTYLQQAQAVVRPSVRIAWPIGTAYYTDAAGGALASASLGVHKPFVSSIGERELVASDRDGGLQPVELTLRLLDYDKTISSALAGPLADTMEGSAVLIRLAPGDATIPVASWAPFFAGVVEQIDFATSRELDLRLRVDDVALRRTLLKHRIHVGDWPHAANTTTPDSPDAVLGQYVPLYFGKHDSRSAGGGGAVKTWNVDDRGSGRNRWLICQGAIASLIAVYGNGVAQSASTYTLERLVRGGAIYSLVTKVTGKFTGPVTVDIEGLDDAGDGTGALVDNPASQIALLLNGWVYNDWGTGPYPTNAPVNATYLAAAEAWFARHGIKGGLRVLTPTSGASVLDSWAKSFPFIRLLWTFRNNTSELGIRPLDWTSYSYVSDPLLRWVAADDGTVMRPKRIRQNRIDRVVGRYLVNGLAGGPVRTLSVRDASLGYNASEDLELGALVQSLG